MTTDKERAREFTSRYASAWPETLTSPLADLLAEVRANEREACIEAATDATMPDTPNLSAMQAKLADREMVLRALRARGRDPSDPRCPTCGSSSEWVDCPAHDGGQA